MPEWSQKFQEFRRETGLINDLGRATALLFWDQDTYMPDGAAAGRGQQLATLETLRHERLTSDATEELLTDLESAQLPPDGVEAAMVREARRAVDRAVKLPGRLVEELAKRSSSARHAWAKARAAADFSLFAPELDAMLALKREEADAVGHHGQRYDALLDEFEPGATTAQLTALFAPMRAEQVVLLEQLAASEVTVNAEILEREYPEEAQKRLAEELAASVGYDFNRGRLDTALHPFAESIGVDDVRITTRYDRNFLSTALFGTLHEAGHALYEQGIDRAFDRSPLGHGASLGMHESQSRLWENLVGRGLPFWRYAYPRAQAAFPAQLGSVPLEEFHAAINRVSPSLIRVEADEVSYNLHVLVRFELELALLDGDLSANDLPGAWNERYQQYLGVTPPDDACGCLQDIHWSVGLIGYFPTYALGNLMSVQLLNAARERLPDLDQQLAAGEFAPLLGFLRDTVHRHGSRYLPGELLQRASGAPLSAAPYLAYLRDKFGALYRIE